MKVIGWCEVCRRVKHVRVRGGAGMVSLARAGVATGVCGTCEDERDKNAKAKGAR